MVLGVFFCSFGEFLFFVCVLGSGLGFFEVVLVGGGLGGLKLRYHFGVVLDVFLFLGVVLGVWRFLNTWFL